MRQSTTWAPVGLVVAVLAGSNVMSNRVLPGELYVPWNLSVAAVLLAIALRLDGRGLDEIGLSRHNLRRGIRVGSVFVGLTTLVYLVGANLSDTRGLFDDARVEDLSLGGTLFNALVWVPLGTVALEEIAFRGVLPAMLGPRVGVPRGVAASSVLFGLWHVLPSMGLGDRNPVIEDALGGASAVVLVVLAVGSTALAGVFLWVLRRWSGSLAAPALAHWSTNGLGYVLAYIVG